MNQPISVAGLADDADLDAEPETAAPSFYSMHTGDLRPLSCCKSCDDVVDGMDYRLYVDASTYGNVRFTRFESAMFT